MSEDFQSRSSRFGLAYERQCRAALEQHGWTLSINTKWREPRADIEIDIVAIDPDGVETWIECKGSLGGDRPGASRTDSAKKFIADAAMLNHLYAPEERRPYMLLTSNLPKSGAARRWLDVAVDAGWCKLAEFPMQIKFL